MPVWVLWLMRQQRCRLGRTWFRFFHRWFHKGFTRARAWEWSLPVLAGAGSGRPRTHMAEVGAGASQSFWLCGDTKCFPLWHPLC